MKFICETFSQMSVTFRDESNGPSSIMIGYSGATVTTSNHPLIVWLKTSLGKVTATVSSCGVNFIIRLHLILLINSQMTEKFS